MFDFDKRQLLIIVASLLLATAVTVLVTIYLTETFILSPDLNDPLARQDGLKPEQLINE
jgi:hypothetical protein